MLTLQFSLHFRNRRCRSITSGASQSELPESEPLAFPGARHPLCSPPPLTGHRRQLQPGGAPRQEHAVPQVAKGNLQRRGERRWRRQIGQMPRLPPASAAAQRRGSRRSGCIPLTTSGPDARPPPAPSAVQPQQTAEVENPGGLVSCQDPAVSSASPPAAAAATVGQPGEGAGVLSAREPRLCGSRGATSRASPPSRTPPPPPLPPLPSDMTACSARTATVQGPTAASQPANQPSTPAGSCHALTRKNL